jgi:hypothetical protein
MLRVTTASTFTLCLVFIYCATLEWLFLSVLAKHNDREEGDQKKNSEQKGTRRPKLLAEKAWVHLMCKQ